MRIEIDDKDIKKLSRTLKQFKGKASQLAERDTVNAMAFEAMKEGKSIVDRKMVVRSTFTTRSIRVQKATGKSITAEWGSIADYMRTQEHGGVVSGRAGNKSIPTATSSGEGDTAYPRRKRVRPANTMKKLRLKHRQVRGSNRKQRNLIAVRAAAQNGDRFIYMDLGRRKGIFRVMGGRRKPRVKMIHDLSRKSVRVPRNPWMKPANAQAVKVAGNAFKKSLERSIANLKRVNKL